MGISWLLVLLELKLLVKGYRWYWFALMGLLWIGTVVADETATRQVLTAMCALAPILVWSKLGVREARFRTNELVYSSPHPVWRSVLPSWVAGVKVAGVVLCGALLGRLLHGDALNLGAWLLAVLFIPSLALALGVWTRTSKVFEIVYVVIWYLGPFGAQNAILELDFLGNYPGSLAVAAPLVLAGIIVALVALALVGRRQQVGG